MSNFTFLAHNWPVLAGLGELAEQNLYHDPNSTLTEMVELMG
jgi:type I restriction enzyme R subunit